MRGFLLTVSLLAVGASTSAAAVSYTASNQPGVEFGFGSRYVTGGSANGLTWVAQSTIIGQTPTSAVLPPTNTVGGGNAIYKPSANKSGVVALIMEQANGDLFICSGSLLNGGTAIATAGHCVSDGAGTPNPVKTTAYFFKGDPDERTPFQSGGTAIEVDSYFVNPNYTGEVIDQNDIAILQLKSAAPADFQRYGLYNPTDLKSTVFNVAGYGTRSTVGGSVANSAPPNSARTGFLREGDNRYEYRWGDALFQGFFTDRDVAGPFAGQNFFGFAEVAYSYVSDFDNGTMTNDTGRRTANALGLGPVGNANFDNTGLGAKEVGIAGGDSGGPNFVDGKLASLNSYGLTFGTGVGDAVAGLNNSFGEFSGYVPIFIHADWISSIVPGVPEPQTWAMLIVGFGAVGFAARRRRAVATVSA